jgi:hypothetical protein
MTKNTKFKSKDHFNGKVSVRSNQVTIFEKRISDPAIDTEVYIPI